MRRLLRLPPWTIVAVGAISLLDAATGAESDRTDRTDRTDLSSALAPPNLAAIERLKREELDAAQALVDARPDDPDAIGILGNVYLHQGRQADAVACWERAVRINPEAPTGYYAMAEVAFLQEDHERAAALWQQAATLNSRLRGVHRRLGETYLLMGRADRARAELEEECRLDPESAPSLFLLGQIHLQSREYPEAERRFRRALDLEPSLTRALYGLYRAVLAQGRQPEATEVLARFRREKGADTSADRTARGAYDDESRIAAQVARTLFSIAQIHQRRSSPAAARQALDRAIQLDPHNPAYLRLHERLSADQ